MPYIPLLSSTLPPATPGPHKTIGYAVVRAPAREWHLPSPVFKSPSNRVGQPALRISGSTWAAYYPAERPSASPRASTSSHSASPSSSPSGSRSASPSPSPSTSSVSKAAPSNSRWSIWGGSSSSHPTSPSPSTPSSSAKPSRTRGWWGGAEPEQTVQWMPDPISGILNGYERYFGGSGWLFPMLKGAASRFQIPMTPNLPMKPTDKPYPLVIFSHGMAGTRSTYSQWCQAIASEGYVVLAVEHSDGSSPCVILPDGELPFTVLKELQWDDELNSSPASAAASVASGRRGSKASTSSYLPSPTSSDSTATSCSSRGTQSAKDKNAEKKPADLYALQIEQRVRELYAAHEGLCFLLAGAQVGVDNLEPLEADKLAASFRGNVDVAHPAFAGHSFGAATVMRALEAPPAGYAPLTLRGVIALDHWWEPFAKLARRPPVRDPPPVLAINSQQYTQDEKQWSDILRNCTDVRAALVTVLGSNHESFCDLPIIATLNLPAELGYLATFHTLSKALLDGTLAQHELMQKEPDLGTYKRTIFGRMAGWRGNVVVHLCGGAECEDEGERDAEGDAEGDTREDAKGREGQHADRGANAAEMLGTHKPTSKAEAVTPSAATGPAAAA